MTYPVRLCSLYTSCSYDITSNDSDSACRSRRRQTNTARSCSGCCLGQCSVCQHRPFLVLLVVESSRWEEEARVHPPPARCGAEIVLVNHVTSDPAFETRDQFSSENSDPTWPLAYFCSKAPHRPLVIAAGHLLGFQSTNHKQGNIALKPGN